MSEEITGAGIQNCRVSTGDRMRNQTRRDDRTVKAEIAEEKAKTKAE